MINVVNNIAFIKEKFFIDNKHFVEMLDPDDTDKQTRRIYTFLSIKYKENSIFIPLRSEMLPNGLYGIIGHALPTEHKPNAGLDFRKMLIINDMSYIVFEDSPRIPDSQQKVLNNDYQAIETMIINYIKGYIKSAIKYRENLDSKYKFSTLHNFHKELGIDEARLIKQKKFETLKQVAVADNNFK